MIIAILIIAGCFSIWFFKLAGSTPLVMNPTPGNFQDSWDESKNEITIRESLETVDKKDYTNLAVEIEFYKNDVLIKKDYIYGLKTDSGKLFFNHTTHLSEEPDSTFVTPLI